MSASRALGPREGELHSKEISQPQLSLLFSGQSQGWRNLCIFQSDFIFYICPLLKLHPNFSMGGAPSQLRGVPQKFYRKSWFDTP